MTREINDWDTNPKVNVIASLEPFANPETTRLLKTVRIQLPQVLDRYNLQELDILSSLTGIDGPSSSISELARRIGVDRKVLRRFYLRAMVDIWVETIGRLDEEFNIDKLIHSVRLLDRRDRFGSEAARKKMSKARIDLWKDPAYRKKAVESISKSWKNRGKIKKSKDEAIWEIEEEEVITGATVIERSDTKYKISKTDTELWLYALENRLINTIKEKGLMEINDIKKLEDYFYRIRRSDDIERVLNIFSMIIAKLA